MNKITPNKMTNISVNQVREVLAQQVRLDRIRNESSQKVMQHELNKAVQGKNILVLKKTSQ